LTPFPESELEAHLPWDARGLALHFDEPVLIPEQPTVTLRGVLGHALKNSLAPGQADPREGNPFWRMFKPPEGAPPPYLIDCAPGAGSALRLRFTLRAFGRQASSLLDVYTHALEVWQGRGFGPARVPYALEVEPACVAPPPWETHETAQTSPAVWRLHFDSPVQLTWRGQPLPDDAPLIHVLAWAGLRRLRTLAEAYDGAVTWRTEGVNDLVSRTGVPRTALSQVALQVTSSIDGHATPVGGLSGFIEFEGPEEIARLLAIGAWIGVGKHTAHGCGRLRVERMTDPLPAPESSVSQQS